MKTHTHSLETYIADSHELQLKLEFIQRDCVYLNINFVICNFKLVFCINVLYLNERSIFSYMNLVNLRDVQCIKKYIFFY